MAGNLQIVFSYLPDGVTDEEFCEWYDAHLPEILSIPGFTSGSMYPLLWKASGWRGNCANGGSGSSSAITASCGSRTSPPLRTWPTNNCEPTGVVCWMICAGCSIPFMTRCSENS